MVKKIYEFFKSFLNEENEIKDNLSNFQNLFPYDKSVNTEDLDVLHSKQHVDELEHPENNFNPIDIYYRDEVNLDPFNDTSWNAQYDFHDLEEPYKNE